MSSIPNYAQVWSGQVPGGYNDPANAPMEVKKGEKPSAAITRTLVLNTGRTRTNNAGENKAPDPPSLLKPLMYAAAAVLTIGLLT